VIAIAVVAAVIGAVSYYYSIYNKELIAENAIRDIELTAQRQASDASRILENKVIDVRGNLLLISQAHAVQEGSSGVQAAAPLFSAAQSATGDFTDSYFWLSDEGKLLWSSSFSDQATLQQYNGTDNNRSNRGYFIAPKELKQFYITSTTEPFDGVPRFYFSYPVMSGQGTFKGVVVASATLANVGQFLQSQISAETPNSIGLLAKDGTILYLQDEKAIGLDYFGEEFQSTIPDGQKAEMNAAIEKMIHSSSPGRVNLSLEEGDDSATLAYDQVSVEGGGSAFAALYVLAPHTVADETTLLLNNQSYSTILFTAALAGVAMAALIAIFRWNRELSALVNKRTSELVSRTKELEFANEALKAKSSELEATLDTLEETNISLKEANEQLKIHDRLQREFVNIAAHELRTPVQPLLGAAEFLESQSEGKDKVEVSSAELEMIIRNAKRLERLSSDILEISRIESGALKLYRENFSLSYIIADAIKDAKTQSLYDPERLKILYYPDDIFVYADREKTIEVITNLLTNALKFTKDGTIMVTTELDKESNMVQVTVSDTGTGIDPEIMPKIFDKFVTKSDRGTGIGLYISKKIVEAHGGIMQAANREDGKGAIISFKLPLAQTSELPENE
jgi:signal transduction histidine kinase